jgi:hypothetical protein
LLLLLVLTLLLLLLVVLTLLLLLLLVLTLLLLLLLYFALDSAPCCCSCPVPFFAPCSCFASFLSPCSCSCFCDGFLACCRSPCPFRPGMHIARRKQADCGLRLCFRRVYLGAGQRWGR